MNTSVTSAPYLSLPIQLVRSLEETLRPEVRQKRWRRELWENKMRVRSAAAAFKAIAGK